MGLRFTKIPNWSYNLIAVSFVVFFISCGMNNNPKKINESKEVFEPGLFTLEFETINPQVSGYIVASGAMWIKKDQIYIKIVMKKGQSNIRYQQYMHSGADCPSLLHDRNKDGVLDYYENFRISGKVLFPLDRDLKDEISGNDWFPVTNKKGRYIYSSATSISELMTNLRQRSTGYGRVLEASEPLDPTNRIIILYGTSSDPLLPVACGRIKKNSFPPWG